MPWEEIIEDPTFLAQPDEVRARVANNYFESNIAADESFQAQAPEVQARVRGNFMGTLKAWETEAAADVALMQGRTPIAMEAPEAPAGSSPIVDVTEMEALERPGPLMLEGRPTFSTLDPAPEYVPDVHGMAPPGTSREQEIFGTPQVGASPDSMGKQVLDAALTARFPTKPYNPNLSYSQNVEQGMLNTMANIPNAILMIPQFVGQMTQAGAKYFGDAWYDVEEGTRSVEQVINDSPEDGANFLKEMAHFVAMGIPGLDEKWAENMFELSADVVFGKAMVRGAVKDVKKRVQKIGEARAKVERGIYPELEVAETTPFKPEVHAKRKAEQIETLEYAENRYQELEAKVRAPRAKPTQPDMIGAREGLEGRVPAEQAPIEAGALFDVEGRKQALARAEGARAQESLPGAPRERRADVGRREKIEALMKEGKAEEVHRMVYEDPLTGLKNKRAWDEAIGEVGESVEQKGRHFASADIAGLKWVNDNLSHVAGDTLIKEFGRVMNEHGVDVYRKGGDEFGFIFERHPRQADFSLKKIQDEIGKMEIKLEKADGTEYTYSGWRLDYETGRTFAKADAALNKAREVAKSQGRRAERGGQPYGLAEVAPDRAGRQAKRQKPGPRKKAVETEPVRKVVGAEEAPPKYTPPKPGDIPAGGMAYGVKLPKYAGGNLAINLERVGGDYSVKKLINDTAGERKTLINEARRGEIKHEATREMADNLGMTYESLLKRRKGQAFNAEEALAARDILATSAKRVVELRKKAVKTNSDADLASFRVALDRHALIQAEVSGIATEAGRALQAHRIESMQKGAEASGNYKAMLEALGGREMTEIILDRLKNIDPENQVAVNIFIRDVTKATTPDKIYEAWINALLSSPTTHVVNITSNTLTTLSAVPESFTGAAIDFARAKATGTPRERYFGESAHKVYGVWDGLKEGVRKGVWSFINEMPTEGVSKLEVGRIKAIKGKKGEAARLPGRFLITADEFFKAVNYTTEVRALAYRQAVKEGMRGKDRSKRIAEIIQNPSAELKQAATKEMLYRVFQQDLGPGAKKISGLRRHWGLRYIAPFIRTPVNIAKYGLERTPLNYGRILHKALKGELKKGELSTELGRATVGSMIGAVVFMHALEGNITGRGPDSKAERQALMRSGWQPYSIKIDGNYYSYGRLEPLGMVLGLHADASEIWEEMKEDEREDVATLIVKAITQNLTSKTWLRGVGDLMNAMTDPTRYAETWTQRVAGTVVPSGVAAVTRGMDPTLRRAETIFEKVRSRIPGYSKKGLPRLDLWGEAIRYGGGPMAQVFSPIYVSKKSASPIDHEMIRLEMTVGMPGKKIKGVKLTPAEHNEYIRLAGTMAKERLDKLVASEDYKAMPDETKATVIKRIITGTRKRAGADVFRNLTQEKR